ncbi:DUF6495 family protein [Flavobacterium oreochromis]|uniref:Histidyl-tRNA synthetase n=2 Tax=Flavobacterium TaxID=237 RepID=A0A246GC41_9FLAO|nr:DUF6495 family protein [Flavobacterium oreochromis]OWP78349.1 hypothetical protein BWG23_02440 [Flavobacterium oreochromis]OWP78456.1 hypothetical protein BWK62_05280 [Flavobacterium oreochromis]POR23950.1 hypothetical protein BWK58_09375 [Flavobacterium columnare]QYS86150.1 hypothetical protein JJC03_14385 [Flavobacterium oreochromis]
MKYKRLTKEQFDSLHQEFANFLATQQIDKAEWDQLKVHNTEVAEQELDVFSDLIWEGVLNNAKFIEHFSKRHIFLFHCQEYFIQTIVIKALNTEVDFLTNDGLKWLGDHLFTENVELLRGKKEYKQERNQELFGLIEQGGILSDGQLYMQINGIIE